MSGRRGPNVEPLGPDRLNLMVQRHRIDVTLTRQLTELAREADAPLPTRATAAGDPDKLRGIPVCGVGGAIRGSRPDRDGLAHVGRLWSLASLSTGIAGTSPGTQPEEALLEKERRVTGSSERPVLSSPEP